MRVAKLSTARNVAVLLIASADHITGLAGATLTITASKDGGAFASTAPTVTDLGSGWYKLALTTTDTNTLGDLALHITATGADPQDVLVQVVAYDTTSATNLGLSDLDATISSRMATYTQPTGFLTATFPTSVASPTNITAATGVVLSGVTHTGAVIPTVSAVTGLTASNLDTTVSSRMATYTQPTGFLAATFPSSVGTSTYAGGAVASVTAGVTVTTNNDKTGYALSAAGVQAVWDALTSALTTVGSIGKLLVTNIDALISSRSTYAGADTAGTTTLLTRVTGLLPVAADYTSARALKLDNLDATVSSRGTSTYAGGPVASVTGAVGSIGAGGIATASFAVGAIDATVLASNAEQAVADKVTANATAAPLAANIKQINGTVVTGNGSAGTPWGP